MIAVILSVLIQIAFAQTNLDPQNLRLKTLIGWNENLPHGSGVRIAVIDSGIIQDFPGRILLGRNFVENNNDLTDSKGHGTGTASVIVNLASDVEIIPLKVTNFGIGRASDVTRAAIYAIKNGAEIINLSVGFEERNIEEIKKNVTNEEFARTLFIVAAGNGHQFIPQNLGDNVIIVGATLFDSPITLTQYSNWGPGVEIAAPAGGINDGITVYKSTTPLVYRLYNGTSAASPVVAGAAAIFKERHPGLSGKELKSLILNCANTEDDLAHKILNHKFLNLSCVNFI